MGTTPNHPALEQLDLKHRMIPVRGITLHAVEGGEGPLVVLLHGFPELWYSWRHQIRPLVEAGYRVVAVDQRGYNLSDKPAGVKSYHARELAADVAALIEALGEDQADLVAHDWGGAVAWVVAMLHPQRVRRLVAINGPHPASMLRAFFTTRDQLLRSWYMFFFQLPWLPEWVIRRRNFAVPRGTMAREPETLGAFSPEDIEAYVAALSQPGALTAGINYYRAAMRAGPLALRKMMRVVHAPCLVIWGDGDPHLRIDTAIPGPRWVPNVTVERIPGGSHWIQVDKPREVNDILLRWLGPAAEVEAFGAAGKSAS